MKPLTIITLVTLIFLLSACGPSAEVIATQTAVAETTIVAETSVAATATAVAAAPKPGHWEGQPSISFEIGTDGKIHDFKMSIDLGIAGTCTVTADNIAVESDGSFRFTFGQPVSEEENIIHGKFETNVAVSGFRSKALFCESSSGQVAIGVSENESPWNAEWKGP